MIKVHFTAAPVVSCTPKTLPATIGTTAVYTCSVSGIPLPTADDILWRWGKLGDDLTGNEEDENLGVGSKVRRPLLSCITISTIQSVGVTNCKRLLID